MNLEPYQVCRDGNSPSLASLKIWQESLNLEHRCCNMYIIYGLGAI